MDRCALFVDAGYLYAAGGLLFCGTTSRERIRLEHSAVIPALMDLVQLECGLPVLRTYWYDAAPNAIPRAEHVQIGAQRNVKLRLGRLVNGAQKGVDSMIVRDLMTLARERAVAAGYLLGGDEDLREGVLAAQDMGMRLTLLGIPSSSGNQAATLIREADENIVLDPDLLRPHFSIVPLPATLGLAITEPASTEPLDAAPPRVESAALESSVPWQAGVAFGVEWAGRASPVEFDGVRAQAPTIPGYLDAQLLGAGSVALATSDLDQPTRYALRAGFWHGASTSAVQPVSSGQDAE